MVIRIDLNRRILLWAVEVYILLNGLSIFTQGINVDYGSGGRAWVCPSLTEPAIANSGLSFSFGGEGVKEDVKGGRETSGSFGLFF
ncbi:MAG: hypothetical protein ACOZCO_16630 [Bacteroidota bacterium]